MPSDRFRVAVAYAACTLIWSTTWFAIRVCIAPGGYPTFAGAAIRFAVATVVLAVITTLGYGGRGPRPGRQRTAVGVAGLLCGLGYGLVYAGETRISGGLAAVIFGMLPIVTGFATYLAGTEKPTRASVAGAAIALAGIALIYRDRMLASSSQALGVTLVFASVCVCAGYNLILKRHTRDTDPLATNVVFLGAAAAALAAFALVAERRLPPWPPAVAPTVALLYLAIFGSVVTFALYFYLIKRMSLSAMTTMVFIEPVLALFIDAAWEREIRLDAITYAGAGITLLGVAVTFLLRPRAAGTAQL